MARSTLSIRYLGLGQYSLDLKFNERKQLRHTFISGESLDVTNICTVDELDQNETFAALKDAGTFSETFTRGSAAESVLDFDIGDGLTDTSGVLEVAVGTGLDASSGTVQLAAATQSAIGALSTTDKTQLDRAAGGKIPVRVATATTLAAYTRTANVITANASGALGAVDGVTLVAGERMLLLDGAAGADNGPYAVTTLGDGSTAFVLTRTTDFDTSAEVRSGMLIAVSEGAVFGDKVLMLTTNDAITLNTTALTFSVTSGVGTSPIFRSTMAADSTLAANVIGATTETIHTAISIPAAILGVARRRIHFRALSHVIAANSTDTWQWRVRIGGVGGTLIADSGAINITTDDVVNIEGDIYIRTLGAGGTFNAATLLFEPVGGYQRDAVTAGAIDTTAAINFVVTGTCSTNNAGNQVSLRHFGIEVWSA